MKINDSKKNILLDDGEINMLTLMIIELSGPLHSDFAQHLLRCHRDEYKNIKINLESDKEVELNHVSLLLDLISVFLDETLDTDWESYYDINKSEVVKLKESLLDISRLAIS